MWPAEVRTSQCIATGAGCHLVSRVLGAGREMKKLGLFSALSVYSRRYRADLDCGWRLFDQPTRDTRGVGRRANGKMIVASSRGDLLMLRGAGYNED